MASQAAPKPKDWIYLYECIQENVKRFLAHGFIPVQVESVGPVGSGDLVAGDDRIVAYASLDDALLGIHNILTKAVAETNEKTGYDAKITRVIFDNRRSDALGIIVYTKESESVVSISNMPVGQLTILLHGTDKLQKADLDRVTTYFRELVSALEQAAEAAALAE